MIIEELVLVTANAASLQPFYSDVLGFPVIRAGQLYGAGWLERADLSGDGQAK
jgi:catechol-2,3-dioxygenase